MLKYILILTYTNYKYYILNFRVQNKMDSTQKNINVNASTFETN